MKVFALIALVPLVAAIPAAQFTAFGGHAVHHAAPALHHAVHLAPVVHRLGILCITSASQNRE